MWDTAVLADNTHAGHHTYHGAQGIEHIEKQHGGYAYPEVGPHQVIERELTEQRRGRCGNHNHIVGYHGNAHGDTNQGYNQDAEQQSKGLMDLQTAEKTVDIILQSPAHSLNIEFQGGEPLLNFGTIKHIVEYADSRKNDKNLTYSVVTNTIALTDEMIEQVSKIAKIQCKKADGAVIKFLEENELSALSLKNGTLTKEEREVIKSHVSHTKDMLDAVSFTGQYKNVPEWASRHHEFLDGSGYPEGLKAEDLAWETRLLTILDIFDALTAEDRPYKTPHTPSTAFEIMRNMVSEGKIDGDILEDLYKSRAWELDD